MRLKIAPSVNFLGPATTAGSGPSIFQSRYQYLVYHLILFFLPSVPTAVLLFSVVLLNLLDFSFFFYFFLHAAAVAVQFVVKRKKLLL